MRRLALKYEGANPTGTVKDRSSTTGVAAALQFGFKATSVVSSGNAGSSIAAYSARAGLRSLIFAYERASAPKLLHMAATTADLVLYRGVYDDLITHWDRLVESRLFFDCGASRNAYKHEGKKTIAYEIAEQSGFAPPDVVVAPVAVGETFIAAARGFHEMREAGWIERVPMMVAAQATRANAVVRAFRSGAALAPLTNALGGGLAQLVSGGLSSVLPFASGGVIASPVTFPLGGRRLGLAGEAGPEAILPLTRGRDGKLGVRAEGGVPSLNVTFNVTAQDAESFRRSEGQIAAMLNRVVGRGARNL